MKIVIGRYREDLSWALPYREHIIIYNKGEQLVNQFSDQRFVPNVGRETHTYYQYIVDHYDCLDNFTIFLQGNPFDHSPDIIYQLNHYLSQQETLQLNFGFLSRAIIQTHLSGCAFHGGLPMREVYQKIFGVAREHMTFRFVSERELSSSFRKKPSSDAPKVFIKILYLYSITVWHPSKPGLLKDFMNSSFVIFHEPNTSSCHLFFVRIPYLQYNSKISFHTNANLND